MTTNDSNESSYITLQQRTLGLFEEYRKALAHLEDLQDDARGGSGLPKHLLQLRLDHEDILKKVVHLHKNLCKALGIDSQSLAHDKDRAHFALGDLDLQKKLKNLAHLAHLLSDMLGLIQHTLALEKHKALRAKKQIVSETSEKEVPAAVADSENQQETLSQNSQTPELKKELQATLHSVAALQMRFRHSLEQLTQAFQRYPGLPEFGILFNHVAGVQHPESLFFKSKVVPSAEPKPAAEQVEQTARWARFLPYR